MIDREAQLQEIKQILIDGIKKKVNKIEDNTEEKEQKISEMEQ